MHSFKTLKVGLIFAIIMTIVLACTTAFAYNANDDVYFYANITYNIISGEEVIGETTDEDIPISDLDFEWFIEEYFWDYDVDEMAVEVSGEKYLVQVTFVELYMADDATIPDELVLPTWVDVFDGRNHKLTLATVDEFDWVECIMSVVPTKDLTIKDVEFESKVEDLNTILLVIEHHDMRIGIQDEDELPFDPEDYEEIRSFERRNILVDGCTFGGDYAETAITLDAMLCDVTVTDCTFSETGEMVAHIFYEEGIGSSEEAVYISCGYMYGSGDEELTEAMDKLLATCPSTITIDDCEFEGDKPRVIVSPSVMMYYFGSLTYQMNRRELVEETDVIHIGPVTIPADLDIPDTVNKIVASLSKVEALIDGVEVKLGVIFIPYGEEKGEADYEPFFGFIDSDLYDLKAVAEVNDLHAEVYADEMAANYGVFLVFGRMLKNSSIMYQLPLMLTDTNINRVLEMIEEYYGEIENYEITLELINDITLGEEEFMALINGDNKESEEVFYMQPMFLPSLINVNGNGKTITFKNFESTDSNMPVILVIGYGETLIEDITLDFSKNEGDFCIAFESVIADGLNTATLEDVDIIGGDVAPVLVLGSDVTINGGSIIANDTAKAAIQYFVITSDIIEDMTDGEMSGDLYGKVNLSKKTEFSDDVQYKMCASFVSGEQFFNVGDPYEVVDAINENLTGVKLFYLEDDQYAYDVPMYAITYEWAEEALEGVELPEDDLLFSGDAYEAILPELEGYTFTAEPSTIDALSGDTIIKISYEPIMLNITYEWASGELEDVDLPSGEQVSYGSSYEAKLPEDDGYEFTAEPSEIEEVVENTVIYISYKEVKKSGDKVTITFDANGGSGTMNPVQTDTGFPYELPANKFTAPSGKKFNGWDKGAVGTEIIPFENTVLKAQWKSISTSSGGSTGTVAYQITTKATGKGTISPNSPYVKKNTSQEFKITPDEGFEISDVLVNGESVGAVSTYTFEAVTKKQSLEVIFVEKAKVAEDTTKKTEQGTAVVSDDWNQFVDVNKSNWFYEAVKHVAQKDIFKGVDEKAFAPNQPITRAMFATVLYRLSGSTEKYNPSFKDVLANKYYYDAIGWAEHYGIVNGVGEGLFAPDANIKRQDMQTMIYRYLQLNGEGFTGSWMFLLQFKDKEEISDYAYEAICYLTMNELIKGDDNNNVNPKGLATRAETAAIIQRLDIRAEENSVQVAAEIADKLGK